MSDLIQRLETAATQFEARAARPGVKGRHKGWLLGVAAACRKELETERAADTFAAQLGAGEAPALMSLGINAP